MKYRSTLIYSLIALLLGGIYFLDIRQEEKEESRKEEARVLFHMDKDRIERLSFERPDQTIVLEKTEGPEKDPAWRITSPVQAAADQYMVNHITNLLPNLKHARIIDENPDNLAPFGLDRPGLSVRWETGEKNGEILMGQESPIDKDYYAKTGEDGRVFTIAVNDRDLFDKSLFELRDKTLFTLAYDQPTKFVIQGPQTDWTFVKSGETTWALDGRPDFPVDSEEISAAVRRVSWEEAKSFEEEEARDLAPYGLDQPLYRIVLADDAKEEELLVGSLVENGDDPGGHYAKMTGRPQIMTIKSDFVKELPSSEKAIRLEDPREKTPKESEASLKND